MLKSLFISAILFATHASQGAVASDLSYSQAISLAKKANQNIFVYFNADWCLPCQLVKDGILSDGRVKKTLKENFVHVEVDIDNKKQIEWTESYGSTCLPHFLVLNDQGNILKEIAGAIPIDLFYNILLQYTIEPEAVSIDTNAELIDNVPVSNKVYPPDNTVKTSETSSKLMNNVPIKSPKKIRVITIGTFAVEANVNNYWQKIESLYNFDLYIDINSKGHFRLNLATPSQETFKQTIAELKANKIDYYIRTNN